MKNSSIEITEQEYLIKLPRQDFNLSFIHQLLKRIQAEQFFFTYKTSDEFTALGVPAEWVPVLNKMGFKTAEDLKAGNPNKVFNDLGGMRKKLKLDIAMPAKESVMDWFN